MPRQIIDIESSRPAYNRRRIFGWIVVAVVVAIAVFFAMELLKSHPSAAGAFVVLFRRKVAPAREPGTDSKRQERTCCVGTP